MKRILLAGAAALLLAFSMPSLADVGIRLHIGGILAETDDGVVTLGIGYSNYYPHYGHYRGRHYLPRHYYHHRHYRPYRYGYPRYGKPHGHYPKHYRHFSTPRHHLNRQHRYPPSRSLRSHRDRAYRHYPHR